MIRGKKRGTGNPSYERKMDALFNKGKKVLTKGREQTKKFPGKSSF